MSPARSETLDVLVSAGVLDRRHRPLEQPPRRVVARACCRAAYLRGAFLGGGSLSTGRSPHLELRTATIGSAELLRQVAAASDVQLDGRRAPDACRRLREELGRDRVRARARGRERGRARPRGALGGRRDERPCEPAGERRSREPRSHEPCGRAPARGRASASRRRRRRAARSSAARGGRAPAPPPDRLAARARGAHRSSDDEGGDAPPSRPARGARAAAFARTSPR